MAERPEDLNLPNSIVARIIKESLPEGINVSKEARSAIAKAASVFVLYTTSCSNSLAMKANRKTISGQDVLSAMSDMEFDRFVEPLKASLEGNKYWHKDSDNLMYICLYGYQHSILQDKSLSGKC